MLRVLRPSASDGGAGGTFGMGTGHRGGCPAAGGRVGAAGRRSNRTAIVGDGGGRDTGAADAGRGSGAAATGAGAVRPAVAGALEARSAAAASAALRSSSRWASSRMAWRRASLPRRRAVRRHDAVRLPRPDGPPPRAGRADGPRPRCWKGHRDAGSTGARVGAQRRALAGILRARHGTLGAATGRCTATRGGPALRHHHAGALFDNDGGPRRACHAGAAPEIGSAPSKSGSSCRQRHLRALSSLSAIRLYLFMTSGNGPVSGRRQRRLGCRPFGERSMYHIFQPECQTQLGRIEQFQMGHTETPANPGFFSGFFS